MENTLYWKSATKKALWGFLLGLIINAVNIDALGFIPGADTLLSILAAVAFIIYFVGISGMRKVCLSTSYGKGVSQLYASALLIICASIIDILPLMGMIASVLNLVAYIISIVAFYKLKKNTENAVLAKGANLLFMSILVAFVGDLFEWIPLIGDVLALPFVLCNIIMAVLGWYTISQSALTIAPVIEKDASTVVEDAVIIEDDANDLK
ncbi:MAG: hypothetical protein UHZ06_02525 [Paludibacteraceae bacterium]|nr:hypothetical protein [Paludibacteraceae bacterium]